MKLNYSIHRRIRGLHLCACLVILKMCRSFRLHEWWSMSTSLQQSFHFRSSNVLPSTPWMRHLSLIIKLVNLLYQKRHMSIPSGLRRSSIQLLISTPHVFLCVLTLTVFHLPYMSMYKRPIASQPTPKKGILPFLYRPSTTIWMEDPPYSKFNSPAVSTRAWESEGTGFDHAYPTRLAVYMESNNHRIHHLSHASLRPILWIRWIRVCNLLRNLTRMRARSGLSETFTGRMFQVLLLTGYSKTRQKT